LNCGYEKQAGVLILDVQMPEMSGIDVNMIWLEKLSTKDEEIINSCLNPDI
jgi:FixJ family two-component response regulator